MLSACAGAFPAKSGADVTAATAATASAMFLMSVRLFGRKYRIF
jgi:hypothetical protein